MPDPHAPAVPVDVEEDPEWIRVNAFGERRRHWNLVFSEHDTERIRLGYCCLLCGESQVDHGGPFPARCWVCGYPMADRQAEAFAREFKGTMRVGSGTSVDEELERAERILQVAERSKGL